MAKFISGPNQRLQNIRQQLPLALAQGNQAAVSDLRLAEQRALSQLVTHATSASKGLQAVAAAASAAAAAMAFIVRATNEAAAISKAGLLTGGTGRQTGAMLGVLGALGIGPGQAAGFARQFRENAAGSPFAQQSLGRSVLPTELDPGLNEAQLLLQGLSRVLDPGISFAAARARARVLGLEQVLALRLASPQTKRDMMALADQFQRLSSPDSVDRALQFQINMQRLNLAFTELGNALGVTVIPVMVSALRFIARGVLEISSALPGGAQRMKEASAAFKQIEAMNANTDALNAMRREFAAGGPRTQAAIPAGLRGHALQRALEADTIRIGAFSVN